MNWMVRAAAVVSLLLIAQHASAQSSWTYSYLQANEADQISTCVASISYRNAWLTVRLHGEEMDLLFHRDDFTLPYGEVLGRLIIIIDSESFLLIGSTFNKDESDIRSTSQTILISVDKDDYARLFNSMKIGSQMKISFPNGDDYPVSLSGSDAALSAASTCWLNNKTGPLNNNPFDENTGSNNPFESL